jgi:GntR family transcriptional regulator
MILNPKTDSGSSRMEFIVDHNSSVPIAKQFEEQIKLAVMMGILRSGDTLPSIRDIEKQTGINRNQIHRAYLALRRVGLIVLTRGKGSVVTTDTVSSRSVSENCRRMSKEFVAKVRQTGISPTAFARFFSRYAQESENYEPLISYIDHSEDMAMKTAAEISQLWNVPIRPLTLQELKPTIRRKKSPLKLLVNHVMCDLVQTMLPKKTSAVIIPIEVHYSQQTIRQLSEIAANSSLLYIVVPQPSDRIQLMTWQLRKLIKSSGVKIASVAIDKMPSFSELLRRAEYDYLLVGPGVIGEVPPELRADPRILLLAVQINTASLEAARIRIGVVV